MVQFAPTEPVILHVFAQLCNMPLFPHALHFWDLKQQGRRHWYVELVWLLREKNGVTWILTAVQF